MIYKRNCPECGDEITHVNPRSFKWAERDLKPCRKCYSKKISNTLLDHVKNGTYVYNRRNKEHEKTLLREWKRLCPMCNNEMSYSRRDIMRSAESNGVVCNSCSSYKYNKTFKDKITPAHIEQMRATKAGFSTFDEYKELYPKKQFYKKEVWRLTYKEPLETLEHWEKRGRCGVEGAYQLDHIQSIDWGWKNNIPAEEIAKFSNLRMLPWKENLLKSSKHR